MRSERERPFMVTYDDPIDLLDGRSSPEDVKHPENNYDSEVDREVTSNINQLDIWNSLSEEESDGKSFEIFAKPELASDSNAQYSNITSEGISRMLECQLCCGQMTETNHLM